MKSNSATELLKRQNDKTNRQDSTTELNLTMIKVPRIYTASKERQQMVLRLGEMLNEIPVFGKYAATYGGVSSLYLQIF